MLRTLLTTAAAAINSVSVDYNAEDTRYFDLNGHEVSNPGNGIYICRQGGKATKVYVR